MEQLRTWQLPYPILSLIAVEVKLCFYMLPEDRNAGAFDPMSESMAGLSVLKPILDALFGVAAIVMFAEFMIVLRRAFTVRFTAGRLVELCVCAFIFVICLDWEAGFDFFKNTVAPIVWSILNGGNSG